LYINVALVGVWRANIYLAMHVIEVFDDDIIAANLLLDVSIW